MLVRSINKENKSRPKTAIKLKANDAAATPQKRPRKSGGRLSVITREEKLAAISAVRRARTLSPPTSKVGSGSSNTPTTVLVRRPTKPKSPRTSLAQAAFLPSLDVAMMDVVSATSQTTASTSSTPAVQMGRFRLPERLGRPAERLIQPEVLEAIDKDMPNLPLEYIKDVLAEEGPEIMQKLRLARISIPQDTHALPDELEVVAEDVTSDMPTHVLAIAPRPGLGPLSKASSSRKVTLLLTHAIILGTHCATIPASYLTAKAKPTIAESTNFTLPVIPLALPDPVTFPLLHFFLYTKNASGLIMSLIPLPPSTIGLVPSASTTAADMDVDAIKQQLDIQVLSQLLVRTFTHTALTEIAMRIYGVWANACCLGVYDESLWNTLDFCWLATVNSFKLASSRL